MNDFGLYGVEFTAEDRAAQLVELESLCDRMAVALAAHDDPGVAEELRLRAVNSRLLQAEGFIQADLNELGGEFPRIWWLNGRAEVTLEPWQEEVAVLHERAHSVASDLRAVATHYRRDRHGRDRYRRDRRRPLLG